MKATLQNTELMILWCLSETIVQRSVLHVDALLKSFKYSLGIVGEISV